MLYYYVKGYILSTAGVSVNNTEAFLYHLSILSTPHDTWQRCQLHRYTAQRDFFVTVQNTLRKILFHMNYCGIKYYTVFP